MRAADRCVRTEDRCARARTPALTHLGERVLGAQKLGHVGVADARQELDLAA